MSRDKKRWRRIIDLRGSLLGLALLVLIGAVGFQLLRTAMLRNAGEFGVSLAGSIASEMDSNLTVYTTLLSFGANSVHTQRHEGADTGQLDAWMQRYFQHIEAVVEGKSADLYGVFDGQVLAANPWEDYEHYDYSSKEWYQRALEADGEIIFTNVYQDSVYGRPVVTIACACGEEGDALAVDLYLEQLRFQETASALPEGGAFFLCDEAGTLIHKQTSTQGDWDVFQRYISKVVESIRRGEQDAYSASISAPDGVKYGVYYTTMPNGWLSIVMLPYSYILGGLQEVMIWLLCFILAFLLLLSLVSWRELRTKLQMERTSETVRVLGNSYYALYRVDFGEGTYEMIKGSDYVRGRIGQKGRYEALLQCVTEVIEQEACQEYLDSFSLANIRRLVSNRIRDFGGEFLRRFGEEYRWVSVRLLFDESLSPEEAVLCFREVDQEKGRQLQERRLLESSLEAARQSEQSKQTFFSNMSHDMRTPLNAIIGLSEMVESAAEQPEKVREYIRKLRVSSRQLLELINDILDMSRMEQGRIELNAQPFNLQMCIQDCADAIRFQAEREDKAFRMDFTLDDAEVVGDPMRISQIMNNLLSNALKFTEPGDSIALSVMQLDHQDYAKYKIVVEDTGSGMSEEFLPRLFEPYTRESRFGVRRVTGTGLGMAIVKSLVERMNGRIHVESTQGEGSTFTVILPFERVEAGRPGADGGLDTLDALSLEGRHILLAEDNLINMELATELLSMNGLRITQAWNGREALEQFKASEPDTFDLILMDMQMPEMDGCEAAQQIRRLARPDAQQIPIIAVTANAFAEDIAATTKAGMDAHISKPIDFQILCKTMTRLLRERQRQKSGEHET